MRYEIWTENLVTGALGRLVASYNNRGHAIARLRGLRRAALCKSCGCSAVVYVCGVERVAGVGRRKFPQHLRYIL